MSLVYDVNHPSPVTGPQAVYRFKEALKAAGWTVPSSGDGLSAFSSSSDVISSGSSGANGFANTSAWARLQSPAGPGSREIMVQRGSSNTVWTARYSCSSGFTGGSPSSTVPGTAADSQTLLSSVTLFGADNTYRMNVAADNAAPYGFFMFCFSIGGQTATTTSFGSLIMDPLLPGSYPASDVDPVVFAFSGTSSYLVTTPGTPLGYLKKGLAGEGFVNIPWLKVFNFPASGGNNSHSFKEQTLPVFYARDIGKSVPVGWKGISSLLRMIGTPNNPPVLLSIASPRDAVVMGELVFPWNGSKILV